MAFLTDVDLEKAVREGRVKIEPFSRKMIGPGSIEFTLDNTFRVFRYTKHAEIDPEDKEGLEKFTETIKVADGDYFLLLPRELVLATTREKIGIPADMVGFIEGKSSWARLGISMHVTAGFIQPGSYGKQTLEIYNLTEFPIRIRPGSNVCQIILAEAKNPAKVPYGKRPGAKYYDQKGPLASRVNPFELNRRGLNAPEFGIGRPKTANRVKSVERVSRNGLKTGKKKA